jgi:hypothetical protein
MLGFSLGKLLLIVIVVAIVWFAFRYVSRVEAVRRAVRAEVERRRRAQKPRTLEAEDLVKCARCGTFVAARSAAACGRPDCPWGR